MLPHPYAELFPMMDKKSLQRLVASIRDDGLEQPIVTFEGKILDGRNRDLACTNAKIKPRYVKYKGTDALGYVIRANLHRRHLTTSQRQSIAAEVATLKRGANQHTQKCTPSIKQAAEMFNVSKRGVDNAKKVKEEDPEAFKRIKAGEQTVGEAVAALYPKEQDTRTRAEADCNRLLSAWDKACPEARQEFLKTIGASDG